MKTLVVPVGGQNTPKLDQNSTLILRTYFLYQLVCEISVNRKIILSINLVKPQKFVKIYPAKINLIKVTRQMYVWN